MDEQRLLRRRVDEILMARTGEHFTIKTLAQAIHFEGTPEALGIALAAVKRCPAPGCRAFDTEFRASESNSESDRHYCHRCGRTFTVPGEPLARFRARRSA